MFENLSLPHILMVVAIALLLFGPKRIPEIAGSFGKGIREFKKNISEATRDEPAPPPGVRPAERVAASPIGGESSDRDRTAPKRLLN
jgi:sec-independent protein translocase protein TatA